MSFSIIDTIQQVFSSDVVNQVASSTGETPPKARSALSAGAFAALAGLIDRGATREGAQGLLASLQRPSQGVGILGDKSEELVNTVASSSGTSQATAQQVLGSITPIAAGILSKHVMAKQLDADGLSSMLMNEKQGLLGYPNLPAPLRRMLGGSGANAGVVERRGPTLRPDVSAANLPERTIEVAHKKTPWGLIAALGIAGLAIIGALTVRGRHEKLTEVLPHVESPVATAPEIPKPELQAPESLPAPEEVGSTTITGGQVAQAPGATPAGAPAQEENYVMNFAFATTELAPGGDATVDRLTSFMKANPNARIRLDGYADSSGTEGQHILGCGSRRRGEGNAHGQGD